MHGLSNPQQLPAIADWIYLDGLSGIMFGLVAFLGAVLLRWSSKRWNGHPRRAAHFVRISVILTASVLVALSGNLIQLVIGCLVLSLSLTGLTNGDAEDSIRAAVQRTRLVSLLGDTCLATAALLLLLAFGTTDLGVIMDQARSMTSHRSAAPPAVGVAAVLLALSGISKAAPFPSHTWLARVHAPRPIVAVLHVCVVSMGGFLILRFADLMVLSAPSRTLLISLGGLTALFASLAMITQASEKASLTYSTSAQMGFVLFACGLGAFSVALLHLAAHACFKTHAILTSGDRGVSAPTRELVGEPMPGASAGNFAMGFLVLLAAASTLGLPTGSNGAILSVLFVLLLSVMHLLNRGQVESRPGSLPLHTMALAIFVIFAYLGLTIGVQALTASSLPAPLPLNGLALPLLLLFLGAFSGVSALQAQLPSIAGSPIWQAVWIHLRNGLYIDLWTNAAVDGIRSRRPGRTGKRDRVL